MSRAIRNGLIIVAPFWVGVVMTAIYISGMIYIAQHCAACIFSALVFR